VRNRRDGSVEAVFCGEASVVSEMVSACRRGPSGAWVDALDEREGSQVDLDLRRPGERFSVVLAA
jgi:acylphosphatase